MQVPVDADLVARGLDGLLEPHAVLDAAQALPRAALRRRHLKSVLRCGGGDFGLDLALARARENGTGKVRPWQKRLSPKRFMFLISLR